MLTRALFALVVVYCAAGPAWAGETKVLALGLTDHVVTEEELAKGGVLPVPRFNSAGIAYALVGDAKAGDTVEVTLSNEKKPLLHNTETLTEDKPSVLLLAGKQGVPAGGWPEGTYTASVKVTRDGKPLIEQESAPVPFE